MEFFLDAVAGDIFNLFRLLHLGWQILSLELEIGIALEDSSIVPCYKTENRSSYDSYVLIKVYQSEVTSPDHDISETCIHASCIAPMMIIVRLGIAPIKLENLFNWPDKR